MTTHVSVVKLACAKRFLTRVAHSIYDGCNNKRINNNKSLLVFAHSLFSIFRRHATVMVIIIPCVVGATPLSSAN
jgi:hypothetical protein